MHTCIHIYTHVHLYIHIYIHSYTYIYILHTSLIYIVYEYLISLTEGGADAAEALLDMSIRLCSSSSSLSSTDVSPILLLTTKQTRVVGYGSQTQKPFFLYCLILLSLCMCLLGNNHTLLQEEEEEFYEVDFNDPNANLERM